MADSGAGLVDIIGPAPPTLAPNHTLTLWAGLLAALTLLALLVWVARRWPTWRARLATRRLCRAYEAGDIDARTAAYQLGSELRRYFRVMRLDAASLPPGAACDWSDVLRRLDRLRYGTHRGAVSPSVQWRRLSTTIARRLTRGGERGQPQARQGVGRRPGRQPGRRGASP